MDIQESPFPKGARGLELEGFVLEVTPRGKVVALDTRKTGKHITLNFGGKSGVIDVHETTPTGRGARYRTLLAIRRESVVRALSEAVDHVLTLRDEVMQAIRPLEASSFSRRKRPPVFLRLATNVEFEQSAVVRRGRMQMGLENMQRLMTVQSGLDGLCYPDSRIFIVAPWKKGPKLIGIGFALPTPKGLRLHWVPIEFLHRFMKHMESVFDGLLQKYRLSERETQAFAALLQRGTLKAGDGPGSSAR